jgi:hypothetical protein
MKFVLVGHFSLDVRHTEGDGEDERMGGLYLATSMLSSRAGRGDVIVPVCGIAREEYSRVAAAFEALPGVSTEALYKTDGPVHRVHLIERPGAAAVVCSRDISQPIPYERLRRHVAADGLLVNMLSGFDITLETLDQIRIAAREEKTWLHLDIHNLTLGVNERHERFRRPVETWRRWAFMIDTVQMNEEEAGMLDATMPDEGTLIGHMLTLGVKGVVVTRGPRGLTIYTDMQKHLWREDVAVEGGDGRNVTGSGDRFGAAFLYNLLTMKDIPASARSAAAALHDVSLGASGHTV